MADQWVWSERSRTVARFAIAICWDGFGHGGDMSHQNTAKVSQLFARSEAFCVDHRIPRWLARAHARSGEPAKISGYLGKSDAFDAAIGEFSIAYADLYSPFPN